MIHNVRMHGKAGRIARAQARNQYTAPGTPGNAPDPLKPVIRGIISDLKAGTINKRQASARIGVARRKAKLAA